MPAAVVLLPTTVYCACVKKTSRVGKHESSYGNTQSALDHVVLLNSENIIMFMNTNICYTVYIVFQRHSFYY